MNLLSQLTRLPFVLGLWNRFPIGPVSARVEYGIFAYPHYAYGVYWAAQLAQRLNERRISVVELGVAGGRGLVALERASEQIEKDVGIQIDIVGFDSGAGMPAPADYRDLPHIWGRGFYQMDEAKLRAKLSRAELVIGDVRETIPRWLSTQQKSPLGFVAFDLDYYSSTKAALKLFDADHSSHLPRVHCYFDDLASNNLGCMNEFVGEHLAIREFNDEHQERKLCPIELLRLARPRWEKWQDRMYAFHDFSHPDYTTLVIPPEDGQLPLNG